MLLSQGDGLSRRFGWCTATAVVVASMVGAGIFTTSGFIMRDCGSPLIMLATWLSGGLIALMGALAYAELGAAMPEAGGEYVYLREAYGPIVAYLSGWTSFFVGFGGALAAGLLAFAGYSSGLFPALGAFNGRPLAILALWILTAAHLMGAHAGARLQTMFSAATVILIVALVSWGLAVGHGSWANFRYSVSPRGHVAVSLILVLYTYSGWNAAAYLGGEITHPERNLPRALIAGTVLVIMLYLALNALYVWAMPISAMSGVLPIAQKAAAAALGPLAAKVVAAIIALAILSSASAMVMAGPRIYFAMGRDGVIPRVLGAAHNRSGPAAAVILQAVWATGLILVFGVFERIVVYTGFAITIFSAASVAAVVVLRIQKPNLPRPFTVPGYPLLPIVYVTVSVAIAVYSVIASPFETLLGLATVAGGLPIYWLYSRREARIPRTTEIRAGSRAILNP
jgi:APA family basic amino acid/polyamine antiporter